MSQREVQQITTKLKRNTCRFIGTAISTKGDDMNDLLSREKRINIIHHLYTILAYAIL
jgi:hypothetical protein